MRAQGKLLRGGDIKMMNGNLPEEHSELAKPVGLSSVWLQGEDGQTGMAVEMEVGWRWWGG